MNESPDFTKMTAREYAYTMDSKFKTGFQEKPCLGCLLYMNPRHRIRITHELHETNGFGYDRREALEKLSKSDCVIDSKEFAKDFANVFGEQLTRRNMEDLIFALQSRIDKWPDNV